MKIVCRPTWAILAIGATLAVSAAAFGFHFPKTLDASQTNSAITALTTEILEHSQFTHRKLDDQLAAEFLQRYLDSLDGTHTIFLQSDEAEFAHESGNLAEAIRKHGDDSLAQKVFQRYLERLDQRTDYVCGLLKTEPFDFTGNDQCLLDRKNAPRPADLNAAQQLWRENLRLGYLQETLSGKKHEEIVQTLDHRARRLQQTMHKLDENAVLDQYLNALAHVYDPHSDYMDREQLQSFNVVMNHSLVGIGASLQSDDGYSSIASLVPGGPAARSGLLKVGDRIVGVHQSSGKDFVDLVDMPLPQVVDLIRGPKGSTVFLEIIPAGASGATQRKTISLVRDEIKLEDQRAKAQVVDLAVAGGGTRRLGIIDLPAFYSGTGSDGQSSASADVAKLLRKLKQEGVAGIILDLRQNGGGSLEEAINLTGLFIGSGPVVQTRSAEGHVETGVAQDPRPLYDGPMVVLTSRLSASASEIVAGALQDYGRAVIVGDPSTFGKGTVQTMVPLRQVMLEQGLIPDGDPGALKVTISKFYRPSGQSTQLQGVKADIILPSLTDIPAFSESKLDNPLPWDTIPAADYHATGRVSSCLPLLRSEEQKRLSKDRAVAWLKSEANAFRKADDKKLVSLNEAKRRLENAQLKADEEALEKDRLAHPLVEPITYDITLDHLDRAGLGKPRKTTFNPSDRDKAKDRASPQSSETEKIDGKMADEIVLLQAEQILADYCGILDRPGNLLMSQR